MLMEVAKTPESGRIENMVDANSKTDDCTTVEAAKMLGVSVRSVQMMVDRGELEAWKTAGGHRRIARFSIDRWRQSRSIAPPIPSAGLADRSGASVRLQAIESRPRCVSSAPRVLLIEDSVHFQKLVSMLFERCFPGAELHIADDAIAGLAQFGQLQPDVLIVDILLPGIDGPSLINSLRSSAHFSRSRIVVITSLDEAERAAYSFALGRLPVIHKPTLATALPALLEQWLAAATAVRA